jgi:transposase
MNDYTGKVVYVGIDVHKKTYAVTCICDNEVMKRVTLKADPKILVEYLKSHFKGAQLKSVYEAGFSGFVLHRYLLKEGIENRVVHAASVEIAARDRVKTDKRDSLKLATQLSHGRLKGIYVPSVEREAYRELSRMREKLTRDKSRVGNRLKSLLMRQGLLGADDDEVISLKWMEKVEKLSCHETVGLTIKVCIDEWTWLKEKLKAIERQLAEQAKDDARLEKTYRSAPGIGRVHARQLANELEDTSQFANEKRLFSFTGLTPSEHSSGEHKRQGHISRQGRSSLRKILVEAAWIAITQDVSLRTIFERTAKRSGKKRAIVGIARRLIGRIHSCFKNNRLYYYAQEKVCSETGEILSVAKA